MVIEKDNTKYVKYKVKSDDTLEGISLKFNVSKRQLRELNSFSSDSVYPGQVFSTVMYLSRSSIDTQDQSYRGRQGRRE